MHWLVSAEKVTVSVCEAFSSEESALFCFCCYTSKATQVKPKRFPHASIHVEETAPEVRSRSAQPPYCLRHHPTAAAPRAKPAGQQQRSTLQAAGHTPAAAGRGRKERTGLRTAVGWRITVCGKLLMKYAYVWASRNTRRRDGYVRSTVSLAWGHDGQYRSTTGNSLVQSRCSL